MIVFFVFYKCFPRTVALTRFLFQLSFLTSNVYALTCRVFLLTHLCVCVYVPLSSLQYWQLLSPKLPCSLCFISSSLLDLLSTSLLCSQLLSTPTKVRPLCCFSPSAVTYWFSSSLEGFCSLCPCFTVCIPLGFFLDWLQLCGGKRSTRHGPMFWDKGCFICCCIPSSSLFTFLTVCC